MSIIETERVFAAAEATLSPTAPNLFGARTPLNIAAAQVAGSLKRRLVTPGVLAALTRFADFAALVSVSAAIFCFM
jgi:hypothetical protein